MRLLLVGRPGDRARLRAGLDHDSFTIAGGGLHFAAVALIVLGAR